MQVSLVNGIMCMQVAYDVYVGFYLGDMVMLIELITSYQLADEIDLLSDEIEPLACPWVEKK